VFIYNGAIDLIKFHFEDTVPKDIDVLFVGTFRNLKGPDRVLQMLALVKKDFPAVKACFIGEGYLYKYCVDLARMLGLSENVSFEGYIDDPATFFQKSKVLVMPSRSEGLPTSMLEAMACGCVPVVSNVGNISDAASHSENAFLVNNYCDIKSFADYILKLLFDESLRGKMAQQGIQSVKDNYSAVQQSKIIDQMIGKLFLSNSDIFSGKSISKSLNFLFESQYWPVDALLAYQEERLGFLVKQAFENVPFYHDLFQKNHIVPSDIKFISDLHKIPVITKDDLREQPSDYYMARNISAGKAIRLNSSGSTGKPFTYFITSEAFSMSYACAIRGWYWMGYRLGDTYAKLSQNPRSGYYKKLQDLSTRSQYLFIRDLTSGNLIDVIRSLNQSKPRFIRCYPDPLLFLAKLINDGHHLHYSPTAINTTGNILTSDSREKIEQAFGAPVFDSYSCEASAQFCEGPKRKSYLSSMEYAITEVLDNTGNPATMGRHITTDLWNLAMPFIRYDTQDIIERSGEKDDSGIGLVTFREIKGRNSDILVTPSGKYLIVHTFTIFFEYFSEIVQFQVIQSRQDQIKILLVVNKRYNSKTEDTISKGLNDLIGEDVEIEIKKVSEIPLLPSGKRKFLIRDESIKLPF
jgi:phenylacetate-CoA ligase